MRRVIYLFITACFMTVSSCSERAGKENIAGEDTVEELPAESIYNLDGEWHSQNGDTLQLAKLRGKIPVVAMVFTGCEFACPKIISDIQNIEKQVPADKKDDVRFVLVSFDSDRDNPEKLKKYAKEMKLDDKWLLLHGDENTVRELSMLLNVKYKKQPNGDFTHSNELTLLDRDGVQVKQVSGLGMENKEMVAKLKSL